MDKILIKPIIQLPMPFFLYNSSISSILIQHMHSNNDFLIYYLI